MSRLILVGIGFLVVATHISAWSNSPLAEPLHPSVTVKTGSAKTVEGRRLLERDGKGVTIMSDLVVRSHLMTLELEIPKADDLPAEIGAARLAVAMNGSRSLPIKASAWLPKSKVWQTLATSYLPTEKSGTIIIDLPWPRQALAADELRVILRIEDHNPGAEPFSVLVDAVVLQTVAGVSEERSPHELAAEAAGDTGPITRVHQFSGVGSSNFEIKQQKLIQNFEKSPSKNKTHKKRR